MSIEYSVARGNNEGVFVSNNTTGRISNMLITNNITGILVASAFNGTVLTRQNNRVSGNTTNVSGTLTPLPAM